MDVSASGRAVRYIRRRGGSLYLWSGNGLLKQGTRRPPDVDFRRVGAAGFTLYIDRRLVLGSWVRVGRDPLPPWRLDIVWESRTMSTGEASPGAF